jgi:HAD superfamily hydrolase (TIGR01509 family)
MPSSSKPNRGFLFDFDGTLVDTNDLHATAWHRVFQECGFDVDYAAIRERIGMGGDRLVPSLAGDDVEEQRGEELRKAQSKHFAEVLEAAPKRVFPKVVELLTELRRRGVRIAIATSSERGNFDKVQRAFGLDVEAAVDRIVSASGVSESKPAPDLLQKAVEELGVTADACVMVGDTPYDALASVRAGVRCVGVLTGGWSAEALRGAGATLVCADTSELLDRLDEALALTS